MKTSSLKSDKTIYRILISCIFLIAVNRVNSQKAISFDSPGDYFEIPHNTTLAPEQFTIELWLKMEDIGDPDAADGEQTILDKRDGESGFNFRLAGTSFPLPVFTFALPGGVSMYNVIRWNTWHHIAVTQDDDSLKVYLDGEIKGRSSNSYASNTTAPLRVGEFLGYPGWYLGLRGDIDDLRIWNYARSMTEIQSAMHTELTGSESGLAAYWNFDSSTGTTISDLSPNGNDGTIYGNATLVESNAPVGFVPPKPPVGLRAYGGQDIVQLKWKSGNSEVESYSIYRGDSSIFLADETSFLAEVLAPESSYTDNTITPGIDYYYCLRASDGDHLSNCSSTLLGRTLAVTHDYETGIYYYPWYGPSDDMHEWLGQYARDYLIPKQPPLLGHYSSRDPEIIRKHLEWMEACGIDFIVLSWWGANSREDITLRDYILDELANTSVKFSVYYESAMLGSDQGQIVFDESNEDYVVADFNYIADTYFGHPNFLKVDNKPVIFLYLSRIYAGDFNATFERVRNEIFARGYEIFLVGDEVGWGETSGTHMEFLDAVSPYIVLPIQIQEGDYPAGGNFFTDLSVQAGEWEKVSGLHDKLVIPNVNPGFNNRAGSASGFAVPRQTDEGAAGTSMLEDYIKVMLPFVEPEYKMIMITSWNEWHEDTQVEPVIVSEPTNMDNSASGHYYTWNYAYEGYGYQYLELIRELLASELPPINFPYKAESSPAGTVGLEVDPNPFHASTMLTYSLLEPGFVSFDIYDTEGRKVNSIPGEYKQSGVCHLDFNAQFLEKGVYILRMKTGSDQVLKKIVKQ